MGNIVVNNELLTGSADVLIADIQSSMVTDAAAAYTGLINGFTRSKGDYALQVTAQLDAEKSLMLHAADLLIAAATFIRNAGDAVIQTDQTLSDNFSAAKMGN